MPAGSAYTARVPMAMAYAAVRHATQRRKDDAGTPYIAHPMAVAIGVWRYGLPDPGVAAEMEDLIVAALLHDVAEDAGGRARLAEIESVFGARVGAVVNAATDSLAVDPHYKAPWRERKESHIARVRELARGSPLRAPDYGSCLVIAADKLDNLDATVVGVRTDGEGYFLRFRGGPEGTRWYYRAMLDALSPALSQPLADHYARLVAELGG